MQAILNIGLNSGNSNIGVATVLRELQRMCGTVTGYRVAQSHTEMTVIAAIPCRLAEHDVIHLCDLLGQEAIAQQYPDGTGDLWGPGAANWGGKFMPEYFLPLLPA
jgi:hypothetical protein